MWNPNELNEEDEEDDEDEDDDYDDGSNEDIQEDDKAKEWIDIYTICICFKRPVL